MYLKDVFKGLYLLAEYSQSGFFHSVSLQRAAMNPWQPSQLPQETHGSHISPGMSSGGCSFPSQSCSSTSPHLPSLNLSIKSERTSPEHMSSAASPPLLHLKERSPMSDPDSSRPSPPQVQPSNGRKEFPEASSYSHENELLRPIEISDTWQR